MLELARLYFRLHPDMAAGAGPCPQPRRVVAANTAMPMGTRCWSWHGYTSGSILIWPQGRARARSRDGWWQQTQPCRWERGAGISTAVLPAYTRYGRGPGPAGQIYRIRGGPHTVRRLCGAESHGTSVPRAEWRETICPGLPGKSIESGGPHTVRRLCGQNFTALLCRAPSGAKRFARVSRANLLQSGGPHTVRRLCGAF